MQGDGKDGPRRPGRLRGIVDAMASPDAGEPSGSGGDGAADAAAPTGRRTRFAPKVPSERRARNPRAVAEETAEPKLSTHVQHLVKQAQLEGKTVRPREPVRGLERRPRRGEADHAKPAAVASIEPPSAGSGGAGPASTSAMDVDAEAPAPHSPATHPAAVFSAGASRSRSKSAKAEDAKAEDAVVTKRKPAAKAERLEATLEATMPASPVDADAPPDWTPDADWTDKTQYYPTVLAPEPRERSRAAAEEASVAARLRHAEAAADEYLVVQLPSRLPLASNRGRGGEDVALVTESDAGPTGGTHRRSDRSDTQTQTQTRVDQTPATRDGSDFDFSVAATLRDLEEGRLGDLEVLADGSARLVIGDASFDVVEGTPFAHVEQLACVDAGGGPDAKCAFLGRVPGRLVCIPDVAELLRVKRE
jgi:hypothetical protein